MGPRPTNRGWHERSKTSPLSAATGEAERAARLRGRRGAALQAGSVIAPPCQEFNARYIAQTSSQSGDATFAVAWQDGEAMSLSETIDLALGEAQTMHPRTRVGMERIVSHSPKAMKSRRSSPMPAGFGVPRSFPLPSSSAVRAAKPA